MAFLANRSVTQRNAAVVASTLTGSTITTSVMTASTLTGSTITASVMGFSTLTGSTTTTSVLGFSTLTGSSIIGTTGQIGSLGYSTLSGSSIVGTMGQIGSLGIGIDPLEGLHSRNVIIVGSTSRGLLRFTSSDGVNYIQSGLSITGSSVAPLHFTGYYGGPLHMAISSNGSVGIGTASPQSALDVNGVISVGTGVNVGGQGININTGWLNPLDYYEWAPFKVSVRSNPVFNVTTQGYVGIGTTAPMSRIHIHSATGNYDPGIAITNSTTTGVLTCGLAGGVGSYAGNAVAGDAIFRNDNASKKVHLLAGIGNAVMTITSSSVGIGTTAPTYPLEIYKNTSALSSVDAFGLKISAIAGTSGNSKTYGLWVSATGSDDANYAAIFNAGNVGIGTSSPVTSLEVCSVSGTLAPLVLTRTGATSNYGVATVHSLVDSVNSFRGYYARVFGGAFGTPATSSQTQANGYYAVDVANAGAFASDTDGANSQLYITATKSWFNTNVGIGVTTPNAPLQFANTLGNRKIVLWQNTNNDHQFFGFGINSATLRYQVDAVAGNHVFYAAASASTSTELMRIQGNGNVGIGTTTPGAYKLYVQGDIYASGNITGLSDRRFKTQIEPLVGALDRLSVVNGYTYFRPDHRPEERQMGLIAQEVQEVYPEAVTYDKENDRYGVNYNAMIAPLVQAMKEMRSEYCAQINHLKEEISSLKARLSV